MSPSKTYPTKKPGLNSNGVREQHRHKGCIKPSAPKSRHFVANNGGFINPLINQIGWKIHCNKVGSSGGYDISVGNDIHNSIMPDSFSPADFNIECPKKIRIEHIGMISQDWGTLIVSRLF